MFKSKRNLIGLLALAISATAFGAEYKAGEVIVKYKDGTFRTRSMMNRLYNAVGVERVTRFEGVMEGMEQLTLSGNLTVEGAIKALQSDPSVEYAQPNYILRIPATARRTLEGGIPCIPGLPIPGCDDGGGGGGGGDTPIPCLFPGIPFPPGCTDEGGGGGGGGGTPPARPDLAAAPDDVNPPVVDPDLSKIYGVKITNADQAWKSFRGTKDFIVADIDTGIDYNHEDLAFNVWRNPNPTQNDVVGFDFIHNDGLPYDDNEHGTHTAGTIGAVGGNGKGVSGVAQRISIMSLKFLSGAGSGTTADAIKAIDYAIAHGAKVLSNSWGGKGDEDNKALYESIERAKAKDVLFIAAAGNDGTNNDGKDPSYPASFDNDNLISVAATDDKDRMASFSNYGPKTTHLGAPGVNIYSTVPGGKYASFSGTSMACPHVAGAAALIWSAKPTLTYKEVKKILLESTDSVTALSGKVSTGGRLNVQKALAKVQQQ